MAKLFHHHAQNGLVRVDGGAQIYIDAVSAFASDNGAPAPALPPGAVERIYELGIRHAISDGRSVVEAGPQPWGFGDAAIRNVSALLVAQAKRRVAVAPPTPGSAAIRKVTP